jgi:23S rRNA pseudouridine1911/1915/1917 synthase
MKTEVAALDIVFEDDYLIILNKPSGVDAQKIYTKGFVVHRIDQRVSGLLLIAKTEAIAALLTDQFQQQKIKKIYKAVVANLPEKSKDTITHWITKNGKLQKAFAHTEEKTNSKKAILSYQLKQSSERYHLLEVQIQTGRFHQIRAQLSAIGSPIVGDVKYGFKRTLTDSSIMLQACEIEFVHPATKQLLNFKLPIPALWEKYGLTN